MIDARPKVNHFSGRHKWKSIKIKLNNLVDAIFHPLRNIIFASHYDLIHHSTAMAIIRKRTYFFPPIFFIFIFHYYYSVCHISPTIRMKSQAQAPFDYYQYFGIAIQLLFNIRSEIERNQKKSANEYKTQKRIFVVVVLVLDIVLVVVVVVVVFVVILGILMLIIILYELNVRLLHVSHTKMRHPNNSCCKTLWRSQKHGCR